MSLLALLQAPLGDWVSLTPIILLFVIMWFLIIRPQQKQQERHRNLLASLKTGDRVVTSGGLHGTIVDVREHKVSLRIAEKVKVDVSKSAVSALQTEASEAGESS